MRHYQDLPPSKLLGARPKQAQASSTQIKKAQYKDHKMDLIAFQDDLSLTNSALFRWNKFPPGIKMGSSTSPAYYLNFVQMSASNERNMMGLSSSPACYLNYIQTSVSNVRNKHGNTIYLPQHAFDECYSRYLLK